MSIIVFIILMILIGFFTNWILRDWFECTECKRRTCAPTQCTEETVNEFMN